MQIHEFTETEHDILDKSNLWSHKFHFTAICDIVRKCNIYLNMEPIHKKKIPIPSSHSKSGMDYDTIPRFIKKVIHISQ